MYIINSDFGGKTPMPTPEYAVDSMDLFQVNLISIDKLLMYDSDEDRYILLRLSVYVSIFICKYDVHIT
jgi:hypothetical protein